MSEQHRVVQIGVVGAMQRSHPALTQLWLQWTGIPNLDKATFDLVRPELGSNPSTQIHIRATTGLTANWTQLCDLLGLPEDSPGRRKMPVVVSARDPAHPAFWAALKRRELEEVDGPIEFWWRLMVLRYKSIGQASRVLIREAIGDDRLLDQGILGFDNPSLAREGRRAEKILVNGNYQQPTNVVVSFRVKRTTKHESLAFSLSEASFKGRFVSKLIDLATARS